MFINWRDLNLAFLLTSLVGGGKLLNETVLFASSVKSLPHKTSWWYRKDHQEPQESSGNAQTDFFEPSGNAAPAAPGSASLRGTAQSSLQLLPQQLQPWDCRDYLNPGKNSSIPVCYTSLRNSLSFCMLPPFNLLYILSKQ